MVSLGSKLLKITATIFLSVVCVAASPQDRSVDEAEFGPVVRAYLGYLRNEQEVVDDRVSRHEVSAGYYRRNSNRIRALRQMAIKIARESRNDYLPELEAVVRGELGILFERPPRPETLKSGEVLRVTFRFLGTVRSGELFYVFARLDPYEQAELMEKGSPQSANTTPPVKGSASDPKAGIRARRVAAP